MLHRTTLLSNREDLFGLETFAQWITSFISEYLYAGIFIGAIIATTFPVIPSEVLYPLAGYLASQNGLNLFEVIVLGLVGGLGATVGSVIIYYIALKLGRDAIVKHLMATKISEKKLEKAEQWFHKYGEKMVFLCRMVPVLRELISVPAGVLGMKQPKFLLYTVSGSCIWSVAWTVAGYYFGKSIHLF